jgi:hypothetical protein
MSNKENEFENFSNLTKLLLSVLRMEIDKRHEKWKEQNLYRPEGLLLFALAQICLYFSGNCGESLQIVRLENLVPCQFP